MSHLSFYDLVPVPVAMLSKAWVCGRLPARLWVRIPLRAWMFVCCECCVLSGRRLCDELITRPEESYRLWCVVVSDLETSWMRRPWPTGGAVEPSCSYAKVLRENTATEPQIMPIQSFHIISNSLPTNPCHSTPLFESWKRRSMNHK
jgi:hypothetical protein